MANFFWTEAYSLEGPDAMCNLVQSASEAPAFLAAIKTECPNCVYVGTWNTMAEAALACVELGLVTQQTVDAWIALNPQATWLIGQGMNDLNSGQRNTAPINPKTPNAWSDEQLHDMGLDT